MTTELMIVSGTLLDDDAELTLAELCRALHVNVETVSALIDEGIVDAVRRESTTWRFAATSVRRARIAVQIQRDLGVNWAGAALVLDMLDELQYLRAQVGRLHDR